MTASTPNPDDGRGIPGHCFDADNQRWHEPGECETCPGSSCCSRPAAPPAASSTPDEPGPLGHDFVGVVGHPDDNECTHRSDGTDATYCGRPAEDHDEDESWMDDADGPAPGSGSPAPFEGGDWCSRCATYGCSSTCPDRPPSGSPEADERPPTHPVPCLAPDGTYKNCPERSQRYRSERCDNCFHDTDRPSSVPIDRERPDTVQLRRIVESGRSAFGESDIWSDILAAADWIDGLDVPAMRSLVRTAQSEFSVLVRMGGLVPDAAAGFDALSQLDRALAAFGGEQPDPRPTELLPAESICLTTGLAQVLRGDDVLPATAMMCVLALARLAGRHDWTVEDDAAAAAVRGEQGT